MRLALLLVAAAAALAACGGSPDGPAAIVSSTASPTPAAIVSATPVDVGRIALPNTAGGTFHLRPAAGHVLLVDFGYTNCPDICPTTLADLRAAIRRLPADERSRIDVAFVTVDPKRDTDAKLRAYLHSFFPTGAALRTGDDALLRRAATAFSIAYEVHGTSVQHSALVSAVTPNGRIAVQWPFGTPPSAIEQGLQMLLAAVAPA